MPEHFDGDLRRHGALRNGLLLHLLIDHDWHVRHDCGAFGVELRRVHHYGDAIGQDWLAFGIQLGHGEDQWNIGRHVIALVISFLNLNGVRLRELGFGVRFEVLNHSLRNQEDGEDDTNWEQAGNK